MTGFGLRDTSNFVVSGYLKVEANPNDCTLLTNTKQTDSQSKAYHNFVSSLSITTGNKLRRYFLLIDVLIPIFQ